MKKILSVLLALLMILSSMTLLVSATNLSNDGGDGAGTTETTGKVSGTSGHIFYSENFDGENLKADEEETPDPNGSGDPVAQNEPDGSGDPDGAGDPDGSNESNEAEGYKKNNDLLKALGWATTEDENLQFTITKDGGLRIVAGATSSYSTQLVQDKDMAGNAITIEYDFTYATEASASSYLSLNVGVDDQNYVRATPVTAAGTIDVKNMIFKNGEALATYTHVIDEKDEKTSITYDVLENLIEKNLEEPLGNLTHKTYRMKCIIDPNSDGVLVYVDGKPMTNMVYNVRTFWNQYGDKEAESINKVVGDILSLVVTAGVDVTIDNIRVSEYAPALQITEVMANAKRSGYYQWIELYNPTDTPTNVYDYCVVIYNGCTSSGGKIGDETDNPKTDGSITTEHITQEDGTIVEVTKPAYNAWDSEAASTIGYFTPGDKTMLVKPDAEEEEDRYQTFTSPAYEDGVLLPGETAIVLLPYTAIQGERDVSDKAFREYLNGLGVTLDESYKTFICDNNYSGCGCDSSVYCTRKMKDVNNTPNNPTDDVLESWLEACPDPKKYPFKIIDETNESTSVALMKVENTATAEELQKDPTTYKPVGIGYGKPNAQQFPYYESYLAMSSKPASSGTTVLGFAVRTTTTFVEQGKFPAGTVIHKADENGKYIPLRDSNNNIVRDKNDEIVYETYVYDQDKTVTGYVFSGHFGTVAAGFTTYGDKSFEISYNRYGKESCSQRMGRLQYNVDQVRPGLAPRDQFNSPGYVPPLCRDGIAISGHVSADGGVNETQLVGRVGADYKYSEQIPEGYEYLGMQIVSMVPDLDENDEPKTDDDGNILYKEELGEIVQVLPADMMTADADITVQVVLRRMVPAFVDYKMTTPVNGKYSINIIAQTEYILCQTLGMRIEMTWVDKESGELQTVTYDRECKYIYDTLTVGGTTYEAQEGIKYYAYQISNVPVDVKNLQIKVTPYYIKGYADSTPHLSTDSVGSFVVNEGNLFFEGDYAKHKDNVGFEYDKSRIPSPDLD